MAQVLDHPNLSEILSKHQARYQQLIIAEAFCLGYSAAVECVLNRGVKTADEQSYLLASSLLSEWTRSGVNDKPGQDLYADLMGLIDDLANLIPTTEVGGDYEVNLEWEIEQVNRLRQKAVQLIGQLRSFHERR